MSTFGVKTKVVRTEILYRTVYKINSGDSYLLVSRTFGFLPNPRIVDCGLWIMGYFIKPIARKVDFRELMTRFWGIL